MSLAHCGSRFGDFPEDRNHPDDFDLPAWVQDSAPVVAPELGIAGPAAGAPELGIASPAAGGRKSRFSALFSSFSVIFSGIPGDSSKF